MPTAALLATTVLPACANAETDPSGSTGLVAGEEVITRLSLEDRRRAGDLVRETVLAFADTLSPHAAASTAVIGAQGPTPARSVGGTTKAAAADLVEDVLAEQGPR